MSYEYDDVEDEVFEEQKTTSRAWWPVIGLLMLATFGALSWFASPIVRDALVENVDRFSGNEIDPDQLQILIAVIIFVIVSGFGTLIFALATPKKVEATARTDKDMIKKRQAMMKRRQIEKARKRQRGGGG